MQGTDESLHGMREPMNVTGSRTLCSERSRCAAVAAAPDRSRWDIRTQHRATSQSPRDDAFVSFIRKAFECLQVGSVRGPRRDSDLCDVSQNAVVSYRKSTAHQRQRPPLSRALSSALTVTAPQVEARAQAKHNAPVDSRRVQSARATERTSTSTGTHQRHQVSYAIPKSRARAASHPVSLLLLPLVRRQKR